MRSHFLARHRGSIAAVAARVLVALVGACSALGATGCASIPEGRSVVDSVQIVNAGHLDAGDVKEKLATTESIRFLGLFRGTFYDYEIFDAAALQRDLARVERYYRGRGFLEAHARAARVLHTGGNHVRIEIVVDEGPPTVVRAVRVDGLEGLPPDIAGTVRSAATGALPGGARFDEEAYAKATTAVTRALTDHGYAYAKVKADSQADLAAHAIDYVFTVEPGVAAVFGPVTLVQETDPAKKGAAHTLDENLLLRALDISPGAPYSTAAIEAGTQALLDLEVLSAVQIVPDLSKPPVVPLTVKVQPSKMHSIRLGGGLEFDQIKTELHGLVGWEDHDFLGNLRDFTIDFVPGVVLYPLTTNLVAPTNLLPEERLRLKLKQPAWPESRTTFFVQPEGNVFPFLVSTKPGTGQPVLGFVELKGAVGLERRFGKHLFLQGSQNLQSEFPFPYTTIQLEQATPPVILSYPQLTAKLDFRDDPIHTHAGLLLTNDLSVAGKLFGGSASDVRVQPEARAYLPITRGVTFAVRGTLGFLFASNYGDYVRNHLQNTPGPNPASKDNLYAAIDRDILIVLFRGFYSGGPSSNRGYPLRGIAPHGVVPFLSPVAIQQQQAASKGNGVSCVPGTPTYDASQCSIGIGGFTQWELSSELRVDVSGPLGVAGFCDAGDVAPGEVQIRLDHLHLSCGAGARYDTPVGAIRLDLAYRLVHLINGTDPEDPEPPPLFNVNGQPVKLAISFGIGEAF